jgi:hypothetical protein
LPFSGDKMVGGRLFDVPFIRKRDSDKAMDVESKESAALLKLLRTKSRTKTELLKVSSARRRARQAALDAPIGRRKNRKN